MERMAAETTAVKTAASNRWMLSLSVGNGGALLAMAAHLLSKDASEHTIALLMPSAWLFLGGLVSAGLLPALAAARAGRQQRTWIAEEMVLELKAPVGNAKSNNRWIDVLFWTETSLEWVSAVAFVSGLAYPLVVMSNRYLQTGYFLS